MSDSLLKNSENEVFLNERADFIVRIYKAVFVRGQIKLPPEMVCLTSLEQRVFQKAL